MPFTFAHPALAIPLRRRADLSALVIGSMVPDAGHFLPLIPPRYFTHGGPGLAMFCLPMGWMIYLLFHHLLREPLIALGPAGLAARLPPRAKFRFWPPDTWHVSLGIVLGALTHVTWDFCTTIDYDWYFAEELLRPLFTIHGIAILPQDILRHGSALIAFGLMFVWIARWWQATAPASESRPPLPMPLRLLLIASASAGIAILALLTAADGDTDLQGRTILTRAIRASLPLASLAVLSYALSWQLWRRVKQP